MSKEIKLPKLPDEIKKDSKRGRLAVFIGAGVSQLYGCDSWKELSHRLVKKCFDLKVINFERQERLLADGNYKKIISFCHNKLKNTDRKEEYIKCIKEGCKDKSKKCDIYDNIHKLGSDNIYLTTNIDNIFSRKFKGAIKSEINDFKQGAESNFLYHLHGHIDKLDSLVLTVDEYIDRYQESIYTNFLAAIFANYTVLFIGYGLNEWEILNQILKQFSNKRERRERKLFILLPVYKSMLEVEQAYFIPFGITVLSCEKKDRGYGEIGEVIRGWVKELQELPKALFKDQEKIKKIASAPYTEEIGKELIGIISK